MNELVDIFFPKCNYPSTSSSVSINDATKIGKIGEQLLHSPINQCALKLNVKSLNTQDIVTLRCKDGEIRVSSKYLKTCTDFQKRFGKLCDLTFFSKKIVNEFINRLNGNSNYLQMTIEDNLLLFCMSNYLHQNDFISSIEYELIINLDTNLNKWLEAAIFYFENREALDFIKESEPFFHQKLEELLCGPLLKVHAEFSREEFAGFGQIIKQMLSQIETLDDQAQTILGKCLADGITVVRDLPNAVKLFRLAADNGYANAQFLLGYCYAFGIGIQKDLERAISLYQLAADQNHHRATLELEFYKNLVPESADTLKMTQRFSAPFQFFCNDKIYPTDKAIPDGVNFKIKVRNKNLFPIQLMAHVSNCFDQKLLLKSGSHIENLEPNESSFLLSFTTSYQAAPFKVAIVAAKSKSLETCYKTSLILNVLPPESEDSSIIIL